MKLENLEVMSDRVLIDMAEENSTTLGGILLPDSMSKETNLGIIVSVGTGIKLKDGTFKSLPVSVGDKIIYVKGKGHKIRLQGGDYLMLKIEDVLGVID